MKTVFVSGLTILAAATALLTASVASADATCKPRLIDKATSFPLTAQIRGQEGTVYMNVVIDENGRAQRADLQRSSGYSKLDRAATRSAVDNWVFDVSACERKDLPVTHVVAVEYHNNSY
ncbi:MAG TPA: TonB family protein [Steroidobacteraceae bacterium]|jgi:TonB family C-terminal domain|nr:TonB family protein [Steroidobacteraceae bacterium]